MRKLFFLLLLLPFAAFSQDNGADSTWFRAYYVKHEYYIPMRDGARLFTSVYMPIDSAGSSHPILMTRTPYSCAPYGVDAYSPRLYRGYLMQYAHEGYIFAYQDVRGAWMSEGEF